MKKHDFWGINPKRAQNPKKPQKWPKMGFFAQSRGYHVLAKNGLFGVSDLGATVGRKVQKTVVFTFSQKVNSSVF